jgi:hypothetical protein
MQPEVPGVYTLHPASDPEAWLTTVKGSLAMIEAVLLSLLYNSKNTPLPLWLWRQVQTSPPLHPQQNWSFGQTPGCLQWRLNPGADVPPFHPHPLVTRSRGLHDGLGHHGGKARAVCHALYGEGHS